MVYNYNKDYGIVRAFSHGEIKWQFFIREIIRLATQYSAIHGKEYTIKQAHEHIDAIKSKTHRIRAYKRFGKWLRETEV